jgi:hypothetical protein
MIERQTMSHPGASIMTDHGELFETEFFHDFDLIQGHGSLRIVDVIVSAGRLAAIAVSAKVGNDQRVALGELRDDLSPLQMRLWIAMQQ